MVRILRKTPVHSFVPGFFLVRNYMEIVVKIDGLK
jgi:hypothetical protein